MPVPVNNVKYKNLFLLVVIYNIHSFGSSLIYFPTVAMIFLSDPYKSVLI